MEYETIRQKIDFYFKNEKAVHLTYKKGVWKRGIIKEISSDFFILDEFYDGKMMIFFSELQDIDVYSTKRGVEK